MALDMFTSKSPALVPSSVALSFNACSTISTLHFFLECTVMTQNPSCICVWEFVVGSRHSWPVWYQERSRLIFYDYLSVGALVMLSRRTSMWSAAFWQKNGWRALPSVPSVLVFRRPWGMACGTLLRPSSWGNRLCWPWPSLLPTCVLDASVWSVFAHTRVVSLTSAGGTLLCRYGLRIVSRVLLVGCRTFRVILTEISRLRITCTRGFTFRNLDSTSSRYV
jgi:hypothetical protein